MQQISRIAIAILIVTGCLGVAGWTQEGGETTAAPWTAEEIRLVDRPGEIVAVLENGMVAIVKENHTAPVAAVRLYVRAGSIYEQEHLGAGLSHLFEHLLAAGATQTRSEEQSRKLIEQIGARYNANTGKARTCYYLTVPSQQVGTALNLVADWVTRPTFPKEAFDREWGVVQRELEMGASDPERMLWQVFDEVRYTVHPGRYPIIGHQAIVQQLTREEILDYYRRMYVPDNCVVSIVGDINAAEMLEEIKREFSDFRRRARVNVVLPEEPAVTAARKVVKVSSAVQGPAKVIVGFPSFPLQHEDLYALDTLANIMGSGQSSRLYQSLREQQQLVLSIDAGNYTPHWASGTFMIQCEVLPEQVEAALAGIWQEIERIQAQGVSAEELARAQRKLQVEHIRSHQTAEQQASTMAEDYLATGDAHFSDGYVAGMQQVTAAKVQEMAGKYLERSRQMTVVLTPVALEGAAQRQVASLNDYRMHKITLENGLRVLLKRNTSVPLISMQMFVMGGLLSETEATNGLTNLMTMTSTKGTANYTAAAIVDYFDGIGGMLETGCGDNTYFYTAEFMPGDFEQAFAIFREVVLAPTFPAEELAKAKQLTLARIEQVANTWHGEASRYFREQFFSSSPYRRTWLGSKEAVEGLSREQVAAFHRESTVGTRSVLAIVGDIDPEEVERKVRSAFAAMPAGEALALEGLGVEPTVTQERRFVKPTAKPGATVFLGYPGMKVTDIKDRYPMEVLMEIVGSNTGWLHELLRGEQLVYYAWGFNQVGLLPGYVAATAQCEAENVEKVVGFIKGQLAQAAQGQISEEEVSRAKSNRIGSELLSKQTNAAVAMTTALDELYGFGYDWSEGYADRIMGIATADVQTVAKKYLSAPATITIVTSNPEAAKGAVVK